MKLLTLYFIYFLDMFTYLVNKNGRLYTSEWDVILRTRKKIDLGEGTLGTLNTSVEPLPFYTEKRRYSKTSH